MSPPACRPAVPRPSSRRRRSAFAPRLEAVERRTLLSTITVTNLFDTGAGSLRAAIASANDGDTIDFAPGVVGSIVLMSGALDVGVSLTIQGPGAGLLTIDGDEEDRIFDLTDAAATDEIDGLTIQDGSAADAPIELGLAPAFGTTGLPGSVGGGIYDAAAHLTLTNDVLQDNTAGVDLNGTHDAEGGALIVLGGSATITGSTFTGNQARVDSGSWDAFGGAVALESASATLSHDVFSDNSALASGLGKVAQGGAVYDAPSDTVGATAGLALAVSESRFTSNTAEGISDINGTKQPPQPASAEGGGLAIQAGDASAESVAIQGSVFLTNSAIGADSIYTGSTYLNSQAPAGSAYGGGLWIDALQSIDLQASATGSVFDGNSARSGTGEGNYYITSGLAGGGAIDAEADQAVSPTFRFDSDAISDNRALGGGNDAFNAAFITLAAGGGVRLEAGNALSPTFTISQGFVGNNTASGGVGLAAGTDKAQPDLCGSGGVAEGGGVDFEGVFAYAPALTMNQEAVSGNIVAGGNGGQDFSYNGAAGSYGSYGGFAGYAIGGGIAVQVGQVQDPSLTLTGVSIANNQATGGNGGAGGADTGGTGGPGGYGGTADAAGIAVLGGMGDQALTVNQFILMDNTAAAGNGGAGGTGSTGGTGGGGGPGEGGGIFDAWTSISKLALAHGVVEGNAIQVGLGGAGGNGTHGAGGNGGSQAYGYGGGIFAYLSELDLTDVDVIDNLIDTGLGPNILPSQDVGGPGGTGTTTSGKVGVSYYTYTTGVSIIAYYGYPAKIVLDPLVVIGDANVDSTHGLTDVYGTVTHT